MADNVNLPASGVKAATDEVTYSGDTAAVQLVRLVQVTGTEGSKTVVDLPGDATNGLLFNLGANNDVTTTSIDLTQSATLVATTNDTLAIGNGIAAVALRISGTWSGTVDFEGTVDGTLWDPIYGVRAGVGIAYTQVTEALNDNIFWFTVAGFLQVRARFTRSSGSLTLAWRASHGTSGVYLNFPIPAGTNYIGKVRLTDGANDASITSSGGLIVGGTVAHDEVDTGNPVKIGMRTVAFGSTPTAVGAADRTDVFATRHGIPFMLGGHPNIITSSVRVTTSQTNAEIIAGTIATGTRVVVTRVMVTLHNATTVNVGCKVGFGSSTLPADSTTGAAGILADHDGLPPGGGFTTGSGSGIVGVGGDGEEIRLTCDTPTNGSLTVTVSYFIVP